MWLCENQGIELQGIPHFWTDLAKEYATKGAYAYVSMIQREERKNKVSRAAGKVDIAGNMNWGKFPVELVVTTCYNHPEVDRVCDFQTDSQGKTFEYGGFWLVLVHQVPSSELR